MKKTLIILLLIFSLVLSGCRVKPDPTPEPEPDADIPEPYSEDNAKRAAIWINGNLENMLKSLSGIATPSLGDDDFSIELGNGTLYAVYDEQVLYIKQDGKSAVMDFNKDSYAVSSKGGEWALTSAQDLLHTLELDDIISGMPILHLERIIYSDLSFDDDFYYHVDSSLIRSALYSASLTSYKNKYPNSSEILISAYKLTLQKLLESIEYDVSIAIKNERASSIKISLSIDEKYFSITENESIKSIDITLISEIPSDGDDIKELCVSADISLQNGIRAMLDFDMADGESEDERSVDISLQLLNAELASTPAQNGITVKSIADIEAKCNLKFANNKENGTMTDISGSLDVMDSRLVCVDSSGALTNDDPAELISAASIEELSASVDQYREIALVGVVKAYDLQSSDISLTVSVGRTSIEYKGVILKENVNSPSGFEIYKKSTDNAEAISEVAEGIIKDLRTKRSDKYHCYFDSEIGLYIIVLGENFTLSADPPEYEYVTVVYDGAKYLSAK